MRAVFVPVAMIPMIGMAVGGFGVTVAVPVMLPVPWANECGQAAKGNGSGGKCDEKSGTAFHKNE
jgi:hypothetical protein